MDFGRNFAKINGFFVISGLLFINFRLFLISFNKCNFGFMLIDCGLIKIICDLINW